jgi:CopA family copper-resistance protein
MPTATRRAPDSFTRRSLLLGAMSAGALVVTAAHGDTTITSALTGTPPVLTGSEFDLVIDVATLYIGGRLQRAITINGSIPAPTLRVREGDTLTIRVHNRLKETTSIHWHGILLPYTMDGVPGISFDGIAPRSTFTYRFTLRQHGTYWYHSHSNMQELSGMYGALIIEPRGQERIHADRDHVILLSDWTHGDPMQALRKLRVEGDYFNLNRPVVSGFLADASQQGLGGAWRRRRMWQQMRMNPGDLADVSARGLSYLMNGCTAQQNWRGAFTPGDRVRLRYINGAGHTFYDVRIPGEPQTVVQVDGVDVAPVTVDEFRLGPGETLDVIVTPGSDACTIFAQSMDRTGFVAGTLSTDSQLQPPAPAVDPVSQLAMGDMMGDMQGHMKSGMSADSAMQHAGHDSATHGAAHHGQSLNHAEHGRALHRPTSAVRHARTEFGPSVDMRVDTPRTNLDDPGVGLRNNGRRVLTLADLHTLGGALDTREPGRDIELHLTGNMERYVWSMDGLEFSRSHPVHLRQGERVRIILHNDTMMTHPMHLHGLWSELESPDGVFLARRHTIPVQPAQRVSFQVTADAPGRWAWHCHLMFHMDSGMFREVRVT